MVIQPCYTRKMAFVRLPSEWIPVITVGTTQYEHYPIQDLTRVEAERILKRPEHQQQILLRISDNARQASPGLYYVATYFMPGRAESVNQLVTHAQHEAHQGCLDRLLPYPDHYSLVIQRDSPFFQHTRVILPDAERTDVKSPYESQTTIE